MISNFYAVVDTFREIVDRAPDHRIIVGDKKYFTLATNPTDLMMQYNTDNGLSPYPDNYIMRIEFRLSDNYDVTNCTILIIYCKEREKITGDIPSVESYKVPKGSKEYFTIMANLNEDLDKIKVASDKFLSEHVFPFL